MTAFVVRENATFSYLRLPDTETWDSAKFQRFCELNRDIRAELDAEGNIIMMTPSNAEAGGKSALFFLALGHWSEAEGSHKIFGPDAGFTLSNGAVRAPDVCLVRNSVWVALNDEARKSFAPL